MGKHKGHHQPSKTSTAANSPCNAEGHQQQAERRKKRFWIDWEPIEKYTWVIAIFTVIYSAVTAGLYFTAKDTLVVSQRAFVFAKQANVLNSSHVQSSVVRPPNTPALLIVIFRNSGQTVATNSISTMGYLLSSTDTGIPSGFSYPITIKTQPVLVAPQSEMNISEVIPASDLTDVEAGKKLLFIYGDITYEDVFGMKHTTEFCFQYFGISFKPDGTVEEYIFYNGPTHNCADDSCEKPK
jgi:hypothetical protein